MKKPPSGSPFELPSDCVGLSVLWVAVQKAKKIPQGAVPCGIIRKLALKQFVGCF